MTSISYVFRWKKGLFRISVFFKYATSTSTGGRAPADSGGSDGDDVDSWLFMTMISGNDDDDSGDADDNSCNYDGRKRRTGTKKKGFYSGLKFLMMIDDD